MSKRTKRQHYVPRLHLRHFVGEEPAGMVWEYDAAADGLRPATPEQVAVYGNFYSVQDENGQYHDEIDHWLTDVETKAAPIYRELLEGKIPQDQERADFSTFLASMHTRTVAMRRIYAEVHGKTAQIMMDTMAANPVRFEAALQRMEKDEGPIDPEIREGLREFILDKDNYTLQVDQSAMLHALTISDELQPLLFEMKWQVCDAGDHYFITSDNPLTRVSAMPKPRSIYGDGGFLAKDAMVTFPLSPKRCLMLTWIGGESPGILPIDRDHVRAFNGMRAFYSERYVYADHRSDGIRRLVQKNKDNGLKMNVGYPKPFADVQLARRLKDD